MKNYVLNTDRDMAHSSIMHNGFIWNPDLGTYVSPFPCPSKRGLVTSVELFYAHLLSTITHGGAVSAYWTWHLIDQDYYIIYILLLWLLYLLKKTKVKFRKVKSGMEI